MAYVIGQVYLLNTRHLILDVIQRTDKSWVFPLPRLLSPAMLLQTDWWGLGALGAPPIPRFIRGLS